MGVTGEPPVGITVVLYEPVAEGAGRLAPYEGLAPPWETKLAQPMRVLLAKWRTNERLPKYALLPEMSEEYGSTYLHQD